MNGFESAWVINNRKPMDCHRIDYDSTKPIYLAEGEEFPHFNFDDYGINDYRLANRPSEEYEAKHPECLLKDNGQMTIFDFMED